MWTEYEMEELLPVVAKLTQRYTGYESTSVTYEKAEQLMEAVIYCIHETGLQDGRSTVSVFGKIPAQKAYELGLERVKEKVKAALEWYNETLADFIWYGNRCLYDTWIRGIPEFFKWYDAEFDPQDTILTLDYPVLKDLSPYHGIDRIYEFIRCVHMEQSFLCLFPEEYVLDVLMQYDPGYQDMIDNICEIVYLAAAVHMLTEKHFSREIILKDDLMLLQKQFLAAGNREVEKILRERTALLMKRGGQEDPRLLDYLENAIRNAVVRLRIAAENER